MRFNPKARLDTSRVGDRRGGGGLGGGLGGSLGGRSGGRGGGLPIPGGVAGGGGLGLVVVLIIVGLQFFGGGGGGGGGGLGGLGGLGAGLDSSRFTATERYAACETGEDANASADCARVAVENSLHDYWSDALPAQTRADFAPVTLTTFTGSVSTACGQASSAVGPFYCPGDQGIYLDTGFFDAVLERQLGGPDGGFVEAYVLAHEYGHHVQNLLGTMRRVRTQSGPDSDAVRLELQADCYAGAWAKGATSTETASGVPLISELTRDDVRLAVEAAEAIGDDRIQERTQGQVTQESWTHGSAEQRVRWFSAGYERGTVEACDTFAARRL